MDHVGLYVGTQVGEAVMVDAPYTGADVRVEPFPTAIGPRSANWLTWVPPDRPPPERLPPRAGRMDAVPHSFRATSGPVIRLRSGNVEAMIASEAASPPATVAQYAIPGMLNAMPTWEWR